MQNVCIQIIIHYIVFMLETFISHYIFVCVIMLLHEKLLHFVEH